MQKNVFEYVEYSFLKLFSKQFWNIAGSSLIISFVFTFISSISLIGGGYFVYRQISLSTFGDDMWLYGILGALGLIAILSLLTILVRGWLAIIIPIRSIDPTESMDFVDDWHLYRLHIGRYFSYVLWYSIMMLAILGSYPILLILTSALSTYLGILYGIGGIIAILYMTTRMYFAWYHMLSEQSGSMKTFLVAQKLTKGKVWKIFGKVLVYALIIGLGSSIIEGIMNSLFSLAGGPNLTNTGARIIGTYGGNLKNILEDIGRLLQTHFSTVSILYFIFGVFYSASSVLSRAMFHIFYVRYYLDIREEYDMESSFIRPMLRKSEHHRHH